MYTLSRESLCYTTPLDEMGAVDSWMWIEARTAGGRIIRWCGRCRSQRESGDSSTESEYSESKELRDDLEYRVRSESPVLCVCDSDR
jgi:hypothetical protein